MTAAYSIFLGTLAALHAPPVLTLILAVFIASVAIGQALFFRGRKPRLASILVGAIVSDVAIIIAMLHEGHFPISDVAPIIAFYTVSGSLFGYIAGVLVGTVFFASRCHPPAVLKAAFRTATRLHS